MLSSMFDLSLQKVWEGSREIREAGNLEQVRGLRDELASQLDRADDEVLRMTDKPLDEVRQWVEQNCPGRLWGYVALHQKVLLATWIGGGHTDFATYVMVVPGENHAREVRALWPGGHSKLRRKEALALVGGHVHALEEAGLTWRI